MRKRAISVLLILALLFALSPQITLVTSAATISEAANSSPDDAAEYNGHYYMLYNDTSSFDEAQQKCVERGGHLATLTSADENSFVYSYIVSRGVKSAYFGYSDAEKEGTWKWVTGETAAYTNWHSGEPNGENSREDYAMFYYKFSDGTWNDGDFGGSTVNGGTYYICEWDTTLSASFPAGYDFWEDSYSFPNYGTSISKRYFTTLYGEEKGTLLWKKKRNVSNNGVCFGLAYTTAAIFNGLPEISTISTLDGFLSAASCSNIRDIIHYQMSILELLADGVFCPFSSALNIGNNTIRIDDYIKYAFIYQWSQEVSKSSHRCTGQELLEVVKEATDNNNLQVSIGMIPKGDGNGHQVLAVGYFGNDILIDDSNHRDKYQTLTVNADGSWIYHGAKDYSSATHYIRYNTDFYMPYQLLSTGNTTSVNQSIVKDTINYHEETFIEGMDLLDNEYSLVYIDADDYELQGGNYTPVLSDLAGEDYSDFGSLFWMDSSNVIVSVDDADNCSIAIAENGAIASVDGNNISTVEFSMLSEKNSTILVSTSPSCELTIAIENCWSNDENKDESVMLQIDGIANESLVSAIQMESGIELTGFASGTAFLTVNGEETSEPIEFEDDNVFIFYDNSDTDTDIRLITNPFVDIPKSAWYFEPTIWAYFHEPQITSGTNENHFSPKKTCTREQIVTFLWKAYDAPEPKSLDNPFSDVKLTKYYFKAVLWAVENGITSGVGNGKFGVGQGCTRAQAMTFLWIAAGKPAHSQMENPFSDVKPGKYYYDAILWAVENGVTSGVGDGKFGVGQTCTRAQIVTFLYKVFHLS